MDRLLHSREIIQFDSPSLVDLFILFLKIGLFGIGNYCTSWSYKQTKKLLHVILKN